jgi:hypothetical protein
MSHGLSRQQRAILGLAAGVNRLTQGTPTVHTDGIPDLAWPLAAHCVCAVPLIPLADIEERRYMEQGGYYFPPDSRQAHTAKASVCRAIRSLTERGLLCEHAHWWGWGYRQCYDLTRAGLDLALPYERPLAPSLLMQTGQILHPHGVVPSIWVQCCRSVAAGQVSVQDINAYALTIWDGHGVAYPLSRFICAEPALVWPYVWPLDHRR